MCCSASRRRDSMSASKKRPSSPRLSPQARERLWSERTRRPLDRLGEGREGGGHVLLLRMFSEPNLRRFLLIVLGLEFERVPDGAAPQGRALRRWYAQDAWSMPEIAINNRDNADGAWEEPLQRPARTSASAPLRRVGSPSSVCGRCLAPRSPRIPNGDGRDGSGRMAPSRKPRKTCATSCDRRRRPLRRLFRRVPA